MKLPKDPNENVGVLGAGAGAGAGVVDGFVVVVGVLGFGVVVVGVPGADLGPAARSLLEMASNNSRGLELSKKTPTAAPAAGPRSRLKWSAMLDVTVYPCVTQPLWTALKHLATPQASDVLAYVLAGKAVCQWRQVLHTLQCCLHFRRAGSWPVLQV